MIIPRAPTQRPHLTPRPSGCLGTAVFAAVIHQIEISKNYTQTEWREDLKTVLKGAGTGV